MMPLRIRRSFFRLVGRQMRFDPRPLLIAEPKQARVHWLVSESLTNPLNQRMVN
jgi:hypothetical protein